MGACTILPRYREEIHSKGEFLRDRGELAYSFNEAVLRFGSDCIEMPFSLEEESISPLRISRPCGLT